ncbi:MAG: CHAD domain-containing protein [Phormidesmis sp.]
MATQPISKQTVSNQISPDAVIKDESLLGGYAYQIIHQQSKQLFKLRSQVLADTDPEPLHQMRISTRRLRSALALFSDVVATDGHPQPDPQLGKEASNRKLAKAVKKLTKKLGNVRDLDVMRQWLKQAMTADPEVNDSMASSFSKAEKKTIKALLKKLKKRRAKQFSKLKKALKGKAYKKLARPLKQWIKSPIFYPAAQQPAKREAIQRLILPISKLLQHPAWLVATREHGDQVTPVKNITLTKLNQLFEQDGELLHDLRKQIKQLRYQTEFFRGVYDITYAAQVREFRNLQSILGQLQDQIVIAQFLNDELGSNWAVKLPTIKKTFQDSRLDLWQQWQPHQRKYLNLRRSLPNASLAG